MKIPVELLLELTRHLTTKEIIKCRLICKEWMWFIDEFCLDELILFINIYPTLELWKSNSKPIDFKRLLFFASDRCLSDCRFLSIFRNVKKLFLTIRSEQEAFYQIGKSHFYFYKNIRLFQKSRHWRTEGGSSVS